MTFKPLFFRERTAAALHTLIARGDVVRLQTREVPVALVVREAGLVIVAGDPDQPLDWTRLKSVARAQQLDVLATYVDPMRSGHRFLLDAVLHHADTVTLYPEYRLWRGDLGAMALVPEAGTGPTLTLGISGMTLAAKPPSKDAFQRAAGLARAQATLISMVFSDTPYATPLERNIGM